MKTFILFLFALSLLESQISKSIFKDAPLNVPKIFGKGIISSEKNEHGTIAISKDYDEIFWTVKKSKKFFIYTIKKIGAVWSEPEINTFGIEGFSLSSPYISRNGNILYFTSDKPSTKEDKFPHIWYSVKVRREWMNAITVNQPFNTLFASNLIENGKNGFIFTSLNLKEKAGFDLFMFESSSKKL